MKTVQEAFDVMTTHLLAQGEPSRANGACAYRGYRGLKCAVGALIPDELYNPAMEGCSADGSTVLSGLSAAGWPVDESASMIPLLLSFQKIHNDNPADWWELKIREVARTFPLSTAAIDALSTGGQA